MPAPGDVTPSAVRSRLPRLPVSPSRALIKVSVAGNLGTLFDGFRMSLWSIIHFFLSLSLPLFFLTGLSGSTKDIDHRRETFGSNTIPPKPPKAFWRLVWEALQDITLIILQVAALVSLLLSLIPSGAEGERSGRLGRRAPWPRRSIFEPRSSPRPAIRLDRVNFSVRT